MERGKDRAGWKAYAHFHPIPWCETKISLHSQPITFMGKIRTERSWEVRVKAGWGKIAILTPHLLEIHEENLKKISYLSHIL